MSKAIQGAAMLAGAIATGAVAFALASNGVGFAALPILEDVMASLALGGVAMEAGALAGALMNNRGTDITIRQPAANRQIVYGVQRVGGVLVYPSTTGSHNDQYNKVVVLSTETLWAIEAIYLDGRRVYFNTSSAGNSTRNGINFGGSADGNNYTGPDGQQYNFGGLVYVEARYGDQLPGDVIGGLTANDPSWAPNGTGGSPYVGGCAYLYVKVEYSTNVFPTDPEIRVTVHGKAVFDPRSGTIVFSANSALVIADFVSDPVYGLGIPVNQEQLIAAANVCDESVVLAAGGFESRYTCHHHFDTATAPSDVLEEMLTSCAGETTMIGGEMYIWPAYWQGPSASFDDAMLTSAMAWEPTCSFREVCNLVTGTYTAPNYPYNIAGNLYDSNGFHDGLIQNNFQFGFQPTNFPQYAVDQLHGYAANEYLNIDSGVSAAWTSGATFAEGDVVSYTRVIAGLPYSSVWKSLSGGNVGNVPAPGSEFWVDAAVPLPMEISLKTVLSISQAQRIAKINLLRSRSWGTGTLEMFLGAFALQEKDVMFFTFPLHGWFDKLLEIRHCTWRTIVDDNPAPGELPKPPERRLVFEVKETSGSIYDWDPTEEQNIYATPIQPPQQSRVPGPPRNMTLTSDAATALVQPDGTIVPRIEVQWDTPLDGFVTQIQMQYQIAGASVWTDAAPVDVALNLGFIGPIIAGQIYNVRIRSVRASGAFSVWVEIDGFTSGFMVSSTGLGGYGPGTLVGQAYTDGTAGILCMPFTALIGNRLIAMFPSGAALVNGLTQQQLWYVYWIDPTVVGGDVTPIATQNISDFMNKIGYFLIGGVVTPFADSSGGGGGGGGVTRYYPASNVDMGSRSTLAPLAAYDKNLSTAASIGANVRGTTFVNGLFRVIFSTQTFGASVTLNVRASVDYYGTSPSVATITAYVNGTPSVMLTTAGSVAEDSYLLIIAAGTVDVYVEFSTIVNSASGGPNQEGIDINAVEVFIAG
jgi:hypothetical protein